MFQGDLRIKGISDPDAIRKGAPTTAIVERAEATLKGNGDRHDPMTTTLLDKPIIMRAQGMNNVLSDDGLNIVFRNARTHNVWTDKPVDNGLLQRVYELAKLGPTSANMCPLRIVFVKSKEAKEKLKPCLDPANVDKTMVAPVTAILGMDVHFYEMLPKLFPHADAKAWFKDLPEAVLEYVALRNSSLQGAYFMLAARSLGLDCGPMSGFNNQKVDAAFFAGTTVKSNFLCNLGHGDPTKLFPRSPRLSFEEACRIV